VPVPSPSLAHGEVDLAAHRASPLSPSAPLLPSTLGVIAGSGPCSARSTAPPLFIMGLSLSIAVWVRPRLSPSLPLVGRCPATGDPSPPLPTEHHHQIQVLRRRIRRAPLSLYRRTGHRLGLPWCPPPPPSGVARSGLNASGPDPCMPGRCGLHR
jgi:hypothetical protein